VFPISDDNPTARFPAITVTFIAACVAVFLWQFSLSEPQLEIAVHALGAIPGVLFGEYELDPGLEWVPTWATLATSMFLHGGIAHLLGNMLYLWIFGNNVEDAMGRVRFVVFYLLCGLAAAMSHALVHPDSQVPMIGASGAISGVMGAYFLLHPHARVNVLVVFVFIQMVALPAWIVLGLWFVMQYLNVLGGGQDGVAWWAHLGGFVAGALLIPLFKRRDVPLFQAGRQYRGMRRRY
jgi:membrane associated rhomboid family serine protease